MIRTKILATLGPATAGVEMLASLFEAGADVCRLNFSHGTLDEHSQMLRNIREAALRHDHPIAVLGDLCGPKIRLGQIRDIDGSGGMPINVGDELVIQRKPVVGGDSDKRVSSTYPQLVDDVKVGDRILIEDGLLKFVCTDKSHDEIRCRTTAGGVLKSGKGINLPTTHVSLPSITQRDWECVDWAIDNDLDYLALSFVRRADEIHALRQHLTNRSSDIQIIAKIEKAEAIQNIGGILASADGLMVARGDLGVEMDVAQVPIIQKELIRKCREAGKPVIVATQMLQSMIESSSPTRAEVSDVANAIFDGTDVVMLSGETAIGRFPVGAVHIMAHVCDVTEKYLDTVALVEPPLRIPGMQLSVAVANGVRQIVSDMRAALVVVYSQTGTTARVFSKSHFHVPIVALSGDHRALRRMALHYGVIPQEMQPPGDTIELVGDVDAMVQSRAFAKRGQRIVIVAGSSLGTPGVMNSVILHTLGETRSQTGPLDLSESSGKTEP
jgi:pyruvate kinase